MHQLRTNKALSLSANVLNKTKRNEKSQKSIRYMLSALFHNHQKHNNINETKQHHVIKKRFRFEKISN